MSAELVGDRSIDLRRGLGLLTVAALGWGASFPLLKLLLLVLPPFSLRGLSGMLAAALALLLAVQLRERVLPPAAQWPALLVSALVNYTGWLGLSILALLWLHASEASILAASTPIWTALLAWPLLNERPTPRRVGGLAIGLAGTAVLLAGQSQDASVAALPGAVCMLGACLCFAFGTVLSKRRPLILPPLTAIGWQVGLGTLPLAIIGLAAERADIGAVGPGGWAAMLWIAVVALCLAYFCWFRALRLLPASAASLGLLTVPVIGVISAGVVLGEPVGWRELVSLALTLSGVALAARA